MKKLGLGVVAAALLTVIAIVWPSGTRSTDRGATVDQAPTVSATPSPETTVPAEPTTRATGPVPGILALASTSEPDEYAAAVAAAVFAHDTVYADPQDYRALLMAEADPQMSTRGHVDLERMVAERIPSPEQWQRMRANEQWSEWRTDEVWQPGAWDEVVTSGQAEPGWAVRNVLGQQTVHFVESGESRTTSRERTITIGMRCPVPGALVDRCRLTLVGIGVVS